MFSAMCFIVTNFRYRVPKMLKKDYNTVPPKDVENDDDHEGMLESLSCAVRKIHREPCVMLPESLLHQRVGVARFFP